MKRILNETISNEKKLLGCIFLAALFLPSGYIFTSNCNEIFNGADKWFSLATRLSEAVAASVLFVVVFQIVPREWRRKRNQNIIELLVSDLAVSSSAFIEQLYYIFYEEKPSIDDMKGIVIADQDLFAIDSSILCMSKQSIFTHNVGGKVIIVQDMPSWATLEHIVGVIDDECTRLTRYEDCFSQELKEIYAGIMTHRILHGKIYFRGEKSSRVYLNARLDAIRDFNLMYVKLLSYCEANGIKTEWLW